MDDSAPSPPPPLTTRRAARLGRATLVFGCVAVMVFAGTEYLAAAFLSRDPYSVTIPASILALVGLTIALLAAGAGAYLLRHWKSPTKQLRRALEEALEGTRPIDQIPRDAGGLSPLLPVLGSLLREVRRQRAEMAKLDGEIRQRVAQRTDALERQVGQLNVQATRDALTGLYNRRMLDKCLDELIQRAKRACEPLCLMMIDVDDFKALNDQLGHAAGDNLLRSVGQLIRSSLREHDLPFRSGGDEFLVILPQSGRAEGEAVAKRLGELVDALTRPLPLPRKPRLSMGISTLADLTGIATGAELMQDADRRLYATKTARKKAAGSPGRAA